MYYLAMLNYFRTILSRISQERLRTKTIDFTVFRHVCIPSHISRYLCEQILHKHIRLFKTYKLCITSKQVHPDISTVKVNCKIVWNFRTAGMEITQGLFPYFRLYFLVTPVFMVWEFHRKNLHCMVWWIFLLQTSFNYMFIQCLCDALVNYRNCLGKSYEIHFTSMW